MNKTGDSGRKIINHTNIYIIPQDEGKREGRKEKERKSKEEGAKTMFEEIMGKNYKI